MPATTLTRGAASPAEIAERYRLVRQWSETLVEQLQTEDFLLQSMADASPAKWHLAHTTWFFETFVLAKNDAAYRPVNEAFSYLFNSYYNAVGDRHPRPQRGMLSRPSVAEVFAYRREVDLRMSERLSGEISPEEAAIVELGLQHEQQHQELLVTDLKHALFQNPLRPALIDGQNQAASKQIGSDIDALIWQSQAGGVCEVGYDGEGFCFDNELPRHRVFLEPYEIAKRLVTNSEYGEFIADGGYRRPELWLSEGWDAVGAEGWHAPLYWERAGQGSDQWRQFSLYGMQAIDPAEPVCHVSLYEADAYARWRGVRLATESEWECAAAIDSSAVADKASWHPAASTGRPQWFGAVWQWTGTQYTAYPGYAPAAGALGEYNGKFMCNQHVLRGSSCATSPGHARATYRNFFHASKRWQFTGIRLARSEESSNAYGRC